MSNYEMAGYFAENIRLRRTNKGYLEKIGIKVSAINLNDPEKVLSVKLSVTLDYDDVKDNQIDYLFGFLLKDPQLQHEILTAIETKTLHENLEINTLIGSMAVHAFPFIRAHLFNLTLDNRHPIQLPLFDLSQVSLQRGMEFKQTKPDKTKIN